MKKVILLTGLFSIPVLAATESPQFFVGVKGGYQWALDDNYNHSNESDAAGFSPLGEVGINYHFNPNVLLSTGYQYIDSIGKSNTDKYDSHGLLVSLTYTFGSTTQPALAETAPTPIIEGTPVKETVTVKTPPQIKTFAPKTIVRLFGLDSIEPGQEFIEQLTETSSVLNSYPQARATVVGHTDSTGSALYNQNLSERRAQAGVNKLIELGATPTQLEWRGEGESQPVADNNTATGRAENRRIEITIPSFQFPVSRVSYYG